VLNGTKLRTAVRKILRFVGTAVRSFLLIESRRCKNRTARMPVYSFMFFTYRTKLRSGVCNKIFCLSVCLSALRIVSESEMVSRLENAALLAIPLVPTAYIVINAVSSIPNLRFALMILIGVSSMALLVSVTRYCIHKRRGGSPRRYPAGHPRNRLGCLPILPHRVRIRPCPSNVGKGEVWPSRVAPHGS